MLCEGPAGPLASLVVFLTSPGPTCFWCYRRRWACPAPCPRGTDCWNQSQPGHHKGPGQPDRGRMSGLGPLSHACRNACLCWPRSVCPSACPSPPPCKVALFLQGIRKGSHFTLAVMYKGREVRSCPHMHRVGTDRHSFVDPELFSGPLSGCWHLTAMNRKQGVL